MVIIFHDDVDVDSETLKLTVINGARVDPTSVEISGSCAGFHVQEGDSTDVAKIDELSEMEKVHPATVLNNTPWTIAG